MSSKSGEYVPSPRPNPRLRPEGAAYAERNRGTMERWFDYSDTCGSGQSNAAPPAAAAAGVVAVVEGEEDVSDYAAKDEGGQSDSQSSQSSDQTPGLLGDGEGAAVNKVTDQYRQLSVGSGRTPAEEAKEYAERNRGQMDHVINNYRAATSPPPPLKAQDVPATHTQWADTGRSPPASPSHDPPQSPRDSTRQRTLHQESQGRAWDEMRPAPRIRPDGESIAQKNNADSMFGIMRSDNSPQTSPVKTAAHSSHHSQESGPLAQSAAQPRARPGEGMRNYERAHNQSEMAAIMRGEGDSDCHKQQRNSRHLQRSELW